MRTVQFLIAVMALLTVSAHASQRSVTVKLQQMNGSGEDGTAVLTESGAKTLITIVLANGTDTRQPAHLHLGTCDDYTPRPAYVLTDVVRGRSQTLLNAAIDKLVNGSLIINVHKSYDDIATQASCAIVKT